MAFDTTDHTVINYTNADGLIDNEQNYLAHTRGPDGRLYFGGIKGITAFDPNDFPNTIATDFEELYIDKIEQLDYTGHQLSNVYINLDEPGPIRIDRSCIQTILSLSKPYYGEKSLIFEWRVDKISPQWSSFDIRQGLTISGMQSGRYELEIRASAPFNARYFRVFRFPFYKAYYLYQRPWFQSLIVLIFAIGFLFLIRLRSEALKLYNTALQTKVAERTEIILAQKQKWNRLIGLRPSFSTT